jgi:hypothetical protein
MESQGGNLFVRALALRISDHVRRHGNELTERLKAWESTHGHPNQRVVDCSYCHCRFPTIYDSGYYPHECYNPETWETCPTSWCGICTKPANFKLVYCGDCHTGVCTEHVTMCLDCNLPMCVFCSQQYGETHQHCKRKTIL